MSSTPARLHDVSRVVLAIPVAVLLAGAATLAVGLREILRVGR